MKTQKAIGVNALHEAGWNVPEFCIASTPKDITNGWNAIKGYWGEVFVRPCPITPQHGFEESIVANTPEEAIECFTRAKKRDKGAEMLLMPALQADYNVLWRPGLLAIGLGNAGATSGKESISIPLVPATLKKELLQAAGITESPYLEAVWLDHDQNLMTDLYPYYTQLRNGPEIPEGEDYIPKRMKVEKVIKAEGDLPEFRESLSSLPSGSVVWHPGGNLGSHYSVHCVTNGIPIVISFEPKEGMILKPSAPLEGKDLEEVKRGLVVGTYFPIHQKTYTQLVAAIIFALHNSPKLSGKWGFYVGAACALMERIGVAACLGEARHARQDGLAKKSRDQVYSGVFEQFAVHRRKLLKSLHLFHNFNWSSGYGGKKWAECGEGIVALDEAIRQFSKEGSEGNFGNMVNALNTSVNQAHNNGWWLNKFCENVWFDLGSKGDPRAAVLAAKQLYKLFHFSLQEKNLWERAGRFRVEVARQPKKGKKCNAVVGYWEHRFSSYPSIYYWVGGNCVQHHVDGVEERKIIEECLGKIKNSPKMHRLAKKLTSSDSYSLKNYFEVSVKNKEKNFRVLCGREIGGDGCS